MQSAGNCADTYRSIKEYENECARVGFTTRRVPFHKDGEAYFALITTPPGHPTGTSIESWTLFTADETSQVLDGVINGHDANYLGKVCLSWQSSAVKSRKRSSHIIPMCREWACTSSGRVRSLGL